MQTIGARYAQHQITLETAAEMGCRACATPGGGCQFLGTAATSQVIAEALGLALPHTALSPSGAPIWLDAAGRSAAALLRLHQLQIGTRDVLTQASLENAMVAHAAFGGSTNLLLHLPAIAFSAGLQRPVAEDWARVNREIPRLVDALPNGPRNFCHGASVSRRRTTGSDAPPQTRGPAQHQSENGYGRDPRHLP